MSKAVCKYHVQVPARWACNDCHLNLCSACAKQRHAGKEGMCPACKNPLSSLGTVNVTKPFWQRIPRFYLYPATPSAPIYLLVLAVAAGLAGTSFPFGLLMQAVILGVFLRYAHAALEHTAAGHLRPPKLSFDLVTSGLEIPFKQLLIFIAIFAVDNIVAQHLGQLAASLLWLVMMFCVPISVMALALHNNLFRAINPFELIPAVTRIGWPYLMLYIFLLLLSAGAELMQYLLYGHLPDSLYVSLASFTFMYFMLAMFSMMGYVIHQYHGKLGHDIEADLDETAQPHTRQQEGAANSVLAEIAVLLKEGKINDAFKVLQEKLAQDAGNLELHNAYHELLKHANEPLQLTQHGRDYITRLLGQKMPAQAAQVLRDCHEADAQFRPAYPSQVCELLKELKAARQFKLGLALANNFHKLYPGHPDIPAVYLLVAQILCEEMKQDAAAKTLLHYLVGKYPDHALHLEIKEYLGLVERLPGPA